MKKFLLFLFISSLTMSCLFADRGMNIRLGFLSPSATKTGIFPGFSYGFNIDNIIDMGLGFDYYYSSDREVREISVEDTANNGAEVVTKQASSDFTTYYVPLLATVRVGVPIDLPVIPYGGVGLGWGLLWEDVFIAEDTTEDPPNERIDEVNFYNGFNWALQLGAKYLLTPNASFYGEAFYNGGRMKKNIERGAEGITWDEINMSGFGLRIGIEVSI